MSKTARVTVKAKECRGNPDKMIRKFTRKVKKEGVLEQARERRYFKKPSIKKKEKRERAARQRRRDEIKRQRAFERRRRKV
jgi:small subunit ribosomal protein S21